MNRPDNLFCPRCSQPGFQSSDMHRFDCASCGFQFYHNVASTTAIVLRCGNEVLFSLRARDPSKGLLDFPGGFVDPGETLEQALRRELTEELNWTSENFRYLFSFPNIYLYGGVTYSTVDAFFLCEVDQQPKIAPQDDVEDLVWRPLTDIEEDELAFVSMKKAVKKLIQLGY